jgi:hypothetical protein
MWSPASGVSASVIQPDLRVEGIDEEEPVR